MMSFFRVTMTRIVPFDVSIVPVVSSIMAKVESWENETQVCPNVREFGEVYAYALGIFCI